MLGSLQVQVAGQTAHFRTDSQRALLAYLAAHQGTPQRRDTLAGLLSPDRPDQEALTYLRNRLTLLRAALGDDDAKPPWFEVDRKQIALRAGDDIVVDLSRFEQLLALAAAHPHRQLAGCPLCLGRLHEAVGLVRGELLAGLNFPSDTWEAWLVAQREYVRQQTVAALSLLREARLARGEWAAAAAVAQRQLALEPWLEAAHRALMAATYHLGDRNAALAQFEQCRRRLWDELGVEPETATRRLRQQIFDRTLGTPTAPGTADNLPPAGPFFGRQAEQAQLLERLVDRATRLVTLVGAGGIGKTRLALEVGRQLRPAFPDGVWLVAVTAGPGGAEAIQIAIGEAAGLGQGERQLTGEQVLAVLRDRQLLLILDNCEAALDELAFLPAWLRRAPGLTILATSREPLNFQAEAVVALGGLPVGETTLGAAEALFAERARMARDDFALSAESLPLVSDICRLVDGSPLAIALAAAWARRRSLPQIREEIGRSLDFLTSRLRDVDPRHRSMRAVFESSWQALPPAEQRVLAALAVFPAGFSAAAAGRVAGATEIDLDRLGEASLLQQQPEPRRYALHSLLRQFAADKLADETPAIDQAFVGYFRQFARDHRTEYARLQPEWGNFLAAMSKAQGPAVLELARLLDEAWWRQIRFHDMRQGWGLALAAAAALPDPPAEARARLRLGEIEMELNDYEAATTHLAQALERLTRLEDGWGIAQAQYLTGRIRNEQARDDEALALFEASRRLFAEEGDWRGVAKNLNLMAVCHVKMRRDFETARVLLAEAVALQQGQPLSSAYIETLRNMARVRGWTGDTAAAEACLIEATDASRQLGDVGEYAAVLYERVLLARRRGLWDDALALGAECLELFRKLGSLRWEGLLKTQLGLLWQAKQDAGRAGALLNEGLDIFRELGDRYEQAYSWYYLYQLYAEIGQEGPAHHAREQARRINDELDDPQLRERLG